MSFEEFRSALLKNLSQEIYQGSNFLGYLSQDKSRRGNDEAAFVDEKLTPILLEALGYTRPDWIYNLQDKDKRPDFRIQLKADEYPRPPFIIENKNTTESLDKHTDQLARYMQSYGTPLGLLYNGSIVRAYEYSGKRLKLVSEIDLYEWISGQTSSQPTLGYDWDSYLRAFYSRFSRDTFIGTKRLIDQLIYTSSGALHDEKSWPAEAQFNVREHDDEHFEQDLIQQTRELIRDVTHDVQAQLGIRLAEHDEYQVILAGLEERYDQQGQTLQAELGKAGATSAELTLMRKRIGDGLHPTVTSVVSEQLSDTVQAIFNRPVPDPAPSQENAPPAAATQLITVELRQKRVVKGQKRTKISSTLLDLMQQLNTTQVEYRHLRREFEKNHPSILETHDAFLNWQQLVADLIYPGEDERQLRHEFASQTAYVLVIRMLLIRIIEDKGLVPRTFTNGGLALWFSEIEERYLKFAQGKSISFLLDMAYANAQHIYAAFYSDLYLFDWYTPDRNLIVRILFRLAGFNLNTIENDLIGHIFARYIEDEHKHRTGMYYTPPEIVDEILDGIGFAGDAVLDSQILDPSCGSGTFLVSAARRIVAAHHEFYAAQPDGLKPENIPSIIRAPGAWLKHWRCLSVVSNLKTYPASFGLFRRVSMVSISTHLPAIWQKQIFLFNCSI